MIKNEESLILAMKRLSKPKCKPESNDVFKNKGKMNTSEASVQSSNETEVDFAGIKIVFDQSIPDGEVHFKLRGKTVAILAPKRDWVGGSFTWKIKVNPNDTAKIKPILNRAASIP